MTHNIEAVLGIITTTKVYIYIYISKQNTIYLKYYGIYVYTFIYEFVGNKVIIIEKVCMGNHFHYRTNYCNVERIYIIYMYIYTCDRKLSKM